MGTGTDALGALAAEYAYNDKGWRTAYILQDTSGEYTKSLGEYFGAEWKQLGGQVVGTDTYDGLESTDVGAQVTKLRGVNPQPDFIYLPAFTPPGVSVIKQIRDAGVDTPIVSAEALDYQLLPQVVGDSTDIYSIATAGCLAYCKGPHGADVNKFVSDFKAKFGKDPDTSFTLGGYELGTVVDEALKDNPGARGEDLVKALEEVQPGTGLMEGVAFTSTCHKPTHRVTSILELQNGQFVQVDRRAVSEIPDVGDNNPCAGG
jgi:branched-chain amino acid transport system substrate-binding protein